MFKNVEGRIRVLFDGAPLELEERKDIRRLSADGKFSWRQMNFSLEWNACGGLRLQRNTCLNAVEQRIQK